MQSRLLPRAWLLLLVACTCAQAQSLNQCRGQGGTVAYRGGDCLPGERLIAVRDIAPDPVPAPTIVLAANQAPRATSLRRTRARQPHAIGRTAQAARQKRRKPAVDPCSREKRARDDFQRRRGIHVTMDELSRWNHRVYDACK